MIIVNENSFLIELNRLLRRCIIHNLLVDAKFILLKLEKFTWLYLVRYWRWLGLGDNSIGEENRRVQLSSWT
jgi:hypothetical protein